MAALNSLTRHLLIPGLLAASACAWSGGHGSPGGALPVRPLGGASLGLPAHLPSSSPPAGTVERASPPSPRDPHDPARDTPREPLAKDTTAREAASSTRTPPVAIEADSRAAPAPLRAERAARLLSLYPTLLEQDPEGAPVRRNEVTLWLPERARIPAALLAQGFVQLRQSEVLGRRLLVLRAPAGLSLEAAVALTQHLAPGAEVDFNHLLLDSGQATKAGTPLPAIERRGDADTASNAPPVHVGLVDEALQPAPELQGLRVESQHCTQATLPAPHGHGTAVARVLARSLRRAGREPVLHAADLGCGPGAVDALAVALQALAQARVPVVNVSAAGPHNRVMAAVVTAFLARGHLLVAAVGNDGPAAPPLYPAAYPGVVAVTGVDRQGQVLVEAGRGAHVAFAAAGIVDLDAADGTPGTWRGTSFAAPVVAAALAQRLPQPDPRAASAAVADLARAAQDLGEPGRDPVYGYGLVEPVSTRMASTSRAATAR